MDLSREAVVIVTAIAGVVAPAWSATQIQLSSGEVLTVELLPSEADMVRFVHPVLGELALPAANVTILPPPPAAPEVSSAAPTASEASAAASTTPAEAAAAPASDSSAATPPETAAEEKAWRFKFLLGGAITDGNSESANLTTTFTAIREVPTMKTALDTGYFFSSSDGQESENRFTAGLRNDWLNPGSKWFYFADARFDNDEFQSWNQRVNGHIGIGYKLIEPPKFKLNLLAGIGAVKEWGSENEDVRPEALFGVEGAYEFADKHTLTFSSTVFPDLNELGEYRWVNAAGWSFLLDAESQLSLNAGVEHEYQSQVDPGRENNDIRATIGVALEF